MKKFLTLRNVLVFCGAFLLVLGFALSFAVVGKLEGMGTVVTVQGVYYNAKEVVTEGHVVEIPEQYRYFATLPVVGFILGAVGGLAAVVVVLVVKNEKIRKFAVLGCAVVALVGAILSFITQEPATHVFAKANGMTYEEAKAGLAALGITEKASVLSIIMSVLGAVGAVAIGASQFVPEKK